MINMNLINLISGMRILDIHIPYKGYDMITGYDKNTNEIWIFGAKGSRNNSYHHYTEALTYSVETNTINNKQVINPPYQYKQYGGFSVQFGNNIYFLVGFGNPALVQLYKFDMSNGMYSHIVGSDNQFPHTAVALCNNEDEYDNIIFGLHSHSIYNYFGYYNLSNNLWTNASGNTLFKNEHYGASCVVKNGYLYAIGGTSNVIDKVNVNGILGYETIEIKSYPILPDRYHAEATVMSYLNYIFIIGGYHNENYNISFSRAITIYDTDDNSIWTYNDVLPIACFIKNIKCWGY